MVAGVLGLKKVSSRLERELARIREIKDPEALLRELAACINLTVENVILAGECIKELDAQGVEIKLGVANLSYLRRVAYGQVSAQLLVNAEGSAVLDVATTLPLPDQERIAANEPIKIPMLGGDDHRIALPLEMSKRDVQLVFAKGRIRKPSEMVSLLREWADKEAAKATIKAKAESPVKVDRKRGGLIVGDTLIPTAELARYLAELSR